MFVSVGMVVDVDMETAVVAVANTVVGIGEVTRVDVVGSAALGSLVNVVVAVVAVAVARVALEANAVGTSQVVGVVDDTVNERAGPFVHASTAFVASVAADAACFAIMAVYVCGSIGSHLPAISTGKTSTDGRYDGIAPRVTRTGKTGTRNVYQGRT